MEYADGIKPDSFDRFTHRWVTPATLVALIGAIIWGVQLNMITLQSVDTIATLTADSRRAAVSVSQLEVRRAESAAIQRSTVLTLDRLERRLTRAEEKVYNNLKEKINGKE